MGGGGDSEALEAMAVMGGCSCATIPAIRPARDGFAGNGSGLLRTARRRSSWGRSRGDGGGGWEMGRMAVGGSACNVLTNDWEIS